MLPFIALPSIVLLVATSCMMWCQLGASIKVQSLKLTRIRQWRTSTPLQCSSHLCMSTTADFYDKGFTTGLADDTIFALSSGPMTKTGVAVIRLSGRQAGEALKILQKVPERMRSQGYKQNSYPKSRLACVRYLFDPLSGDMLDQALVLWMPGPRSFTGEDVVELHTHGSRAVIMGIFSALEYIDNNRNQFEGFERGGIRAAERGEFTRRAFDNGRMDLTEVEGLSDLLDADTNLQRVQALKQMEGHLSAVFERWRAALVKFLAHTEAVIDFGDDDREEDVDDSSLYMLLPKVKELRIEIETHLQDGRKGELVREGLRIALAGPPNAGKSSLMNALAKRPAAIVSPIAGTTRDIVEVRMDLAGVSCSVSDTAGLRDSTDDPIELEGIKRAREAFRRAHLKVFVGDASDPASMKQAATMLKSMQDDSSLDEEGVTGMAGEDKVLFVLNKKDLVVDDSADSSLTSQGLIDATFVPISCSTGEGLAELEQTLETSIQDLVSSSSGEGTLITRERHRRHLQRCAAHLDEFLNGTLPMDAAAEELRLASLELGRVTGRVDVEELLDIIFKDFCIGK